MKIEVNITKTYFYIILTVIILTAGIIFVIAQTPAPNPGHSANSIGPGNFSGVPSDIWTFPGFIRSKQGGGVYDVWIQGGPDSTGGDLRNLAILGQDEDSGDSLWFNYNSEYQAGTRIGGPICYGSSSNCVTGLSQTQLVEKTPACCSGSVSHTFGFTPDYVLIIVSKAPGTEGDSSWVIMQGQTGQIFAADYGTQSLTLTSAQLSGSAISFSFSCNGCIAGTMRFHLMAVNE